MRLTARYLNWLARPESTLDAQCSNYPTVSTKGSTEKHGPTIHECRRKRERSLPDKGPQGTASGHTLADHEYGDVFFHEHGPDADHDHDDEFFNGPIEENPLWIADNVVLNSVGIDVGSSGTQVIFSRIHLRRLAEDMTSRYFVVKRETLFQSPVMLTPYESETRISDPNWEKSSTMPTTRRASAPAT